jgi:enoyl-CoA hydratase/carnithine racemase
MSGDLLIERRDGIATVIFNRPEQRNAIHYEMWRGIARLMAECGKDKSVRVAVFRGAGQEAFSAGADIAEFDRHRKDSTVAQRYHRAVEGALDAVAALPKPTMALITGFCVGGGCELATATDIRVAAENSRFGIPSAKLGLLVGYREMQRLVRLVGPGVAMDLLLTARLMDAEEALRVGLISRLVPLVEIEESVRTLAGEVASLAPLAHQGHKQILETVLSNPRLKGLTPKQKRLPFACYDTADFHEGRRAFLEKRRAQFKGR